MLLSIGMIVKNEEKYLRDCLNGIKPILDNLDAELIIADTGSTDSTIEIAKEFTDKVMEIKWKDDFAHARQHTLDRARGKWYMYIDADEILQDVSEFIDFFKSGDYKDFGYATLSMKNVTPNLDEDSYSTFSALRLAQRHKKLYWSGTIHEYMTPLKSPGKNLPTVVLHYGYNFETEEAKQAKLIRNTTPLLKWFKNEPDNPRPILQLAVEYRAVSDFDEAMKYMDLGLKLFEKDSTDMFYHSFMQQLVAILYISGKKEEAAKASKEYFDEASILYGNAFCVKYYESLSLFELKRYPEASAALRKTQELLRQKEEGELDNYILSYLPVLNVTHEKLEAFLKQVHLFAGEFEEYIELKGTDDYLRDLNLAYTVFIDVVANTTPLELEKIYTHAVANFKVNSFEYNNAISVLEKSIAMPLMKKIISGVLIKHDDFGDGYIYLNKLRQTGDKKHLDYFLNTPAQRHQCFGDVVYHAIKHNADFTNFVENLQITNTSDFVRSFVGTNESLGYALLDYLKSQPINTIKSFRLMCGILYLSYSVEKEQKLKLEYFEAYIRMNYKLSAYLYREDVFCEGAVQALPEQDCFTFYVGNAYHCKDKGDGSGYVRNLRTALQVLPSMKDTIVELLEEFANPAPPENSAIQDLGGGI